MLRETLSHFTLKNVAPVTDSKCAKYGQPNNFWGFGETPVIYNVSTMVTTAAAASPVCLVRLGGGRDFDWYWYPFDSLDDPP